MHFRKECDLPVFKWTCFQNENSTYSLFSDISFIWIIRLPSVWVIRNSDIAKVCNSHRGTVPQGSSAHAKINFNLVNKTSILCSSLISSGYTQMVFQERGSQEKNIKTYTEHVVTWVYICGWVHRYMIFLEESTYIINSIIFKQMARAWCYIGKKVWIKKYKKDSNSGFSVRGRWCLQM